MIYITGEITLESFVEFNKQLTDHVTKRSSIIDILLMSTGGSAEAALAYFDKINRVGNYTVRITATGSVESAAVLILAAGKYRKMTKSAWVMVHEESVEDMEKMNVVQLERYSAQLRRMENQWAKLLEEQTGTSAEIWTKLHKEETYLTAEECFKLGLIEEIV